MTSITTQDYSIHFNDNAYKALNEHLKKSNYSKIFLLVDENTNADCVPFFLGNIDADIAYEIFEIESGEETPTESKEKTKDPAETPAKEEVEEVVEEVVPTEDTAASNEEE